jgi:hypothetical protein
MGPVELVTLPVRLVLIESEAEIKCALRPTHSNKLPLPLLTLTLPLPQVLRKTLPPAFPPESFPKFFLAGVLNRWLCSSDT